jgi:hypothetical protein
MAMEVYPWLALESGTISSTGEPTENVLGRHQVGMT